MYKSAKIVISSIIGNALENYDYILYVNFAFILSQLFFPSENLYVSLIATFGVFAAGFLMRPVGALIFGHIGDKYSRKKALSISIILMSFPTTLIGCLPSYHDIGMLAPILLVIIRLLQGISIGGETSGFMTYLMEAMPNSKRKALIGSLALTSTACGLFLGFLAVFIHNLFFAEISWAWRVPFLISFPIGMIGFYIRSRLEDGPEFTSLKETGQLAEFPLKKLLQNHKKRLLIISGLFASISVQFYVFFAFLSNFLIKILEYDALQISAIYLLSTVIFASVAPISGLLSDRFGIFKVLLCAMLSFTILLFPIFYLIFSKDPALTLIGCILFITSAALYQGSVPVVILKIFPTQVRAIGTALSFNIISVIFGGLTPMFLTFLIKIGFSYYVVPIYLLVVFLGTISAIFIGNRNKLL